MKQSGPDRLVSGLRMRNTHKWRAAIAAGEEVNNWCRQLAITAAREGPLFGATNKEMALEATNNKLGDIQQRNGLTNDHLTAAHEQTHNDHGMDHNSAQIDPTQAKAAELAVESEGQELAAFLI